MEAILHALARFVARQPILDGSQNVVGYELLFRQGLENRFPDVDRTAASRSVIDNSLVVGVDQLCAGRRAFINCTREVLLDAALTALPPKTTVIEVLENIEADAEVVEACVRLKAAGYTIALDDFVLNGPQVSLLPLADIIKLDIRETPLRELRGLIGDLLAHKLVLLAEKVETQQEFDEARALGFTQFQGFFFAKPAIMEVPDLPVATLNRVRLLQYVASPELDFAKIEEGIKLDAALCYRLLRYMNSAQFSLSGEISSIRHALTLLGEQEIRRWVTLLVAFVTVQDRPGVLFQQALMRAHLCELLAKALKWRSSDYFLLGLFSMMDVILNMPMKALLERVVLPAKTQAALLGKPGAPTQLLDLLRAYERADWGACDNLTECLGLDENAVSQAYVESVSRTMDSTRRAGIVI